MPTPQVISRVFRLTMRRRIVGGFVIVLALLVVLAVVMRRGANSVIDVADEVRSGSAASEAASDIALRVGDVHARTMQYASSASVVDQKAVLSRGSSAPRVAPRSSPGRWTGSTARSSSRCTAVAAA